MKHSDRPMATADELYSLPLDEFTAARNDLERRLRRDGEREEAQAVKALRKPTVAAWALNQVARQNEEGLKALLGAGERLRGAQEALLEGGDRGELAAAAEEERESVGRLSREAAAIAAEAGVATGAGLDEKLRATLHAAATDAEVAGELAAGRLTREREVMGMFGLAEPPAETAPARRPAKAGRRGAAKAKDDGEAERAKAEEKAAEEAERRAREVERELKAAGRAESKARRRLAQAERTAEAARERATAAAERLRAAEREERDAAGNLQAAEEEVRRLDEELSALRDR
jgi:hypothetical protein